MCLAPTVSPLPHIHRHKFVQQNIEPILSPEGGGTNLNRSTHVILVFVVHVVLSIMALHIISVNSSHTYM